MASAAPPIALRAPETELEKQIEQMQSAVQDALQRLAVGGMRALAPPPPSAAASPASLSTAVSRLFAASGVGSPSLASSPLTAAQFASPARPESETQGGDSSVTAGAGEVAQATRTRIRMLLATVTRANSRLRGLTGVGPLKPLLFARRAQMLEERRSALAELAQLIAHCESAEQGEAEEALNALRSMVML